MNHSEIVRILSDRSGMTQKDVKQLLSSIVKSLGDILGEYRGFTIPELGTFGTHVREERKAYSIPDGRNMIIPPKRLVFFGPAADLKDEYKSSSEEITSAAPPADKQALSEHEIMRLEMEADTEADKQTEPSDDDAGAAQGPADEQEEQLD